MPIKFSGWEACCEKAKQLKPGQAPKKNHGYTMFHGTLKSSAQNIISSGFRPSVNGTLGPGVYCSRDINKAMGYPGGCLDSNRVVLKLRVRVGKVKKIDAQSINMCNTWHQHGYDTAWLPSTMGGFEEDCVWDPKRLTVVGIAYCSDPATKTHLENLIKQQGGGTGQSQSKQLGSQCTGCGIKTLEKHTVQKCWTCKTAICAFMDKHVCQ
ncbi:gig2-like protein DreN [Hoplias malabaricus]|uniref:gig2-like protein DreN n=1 Tax=Hoplias malabaricus TaxID=27720 RepID=UPI003462767C